jgi:putative glycosyltransferase (TIGR04372 family)
MWDRTLRVSPMAWPVYTVSRFLPGSKKHLIPMSDRDINGLIAHSQPHLTFTNEEEQQGLAALRKMGIPDGAQFVCFFARDSAYLDSLLVRSFQSRIFQYHDYRDSNIHNYIPAVEEMTRRGYYALRMGAVVKEALITTNSMIIDYAINHRSDFLDIFLCAKCRFFLGDTAGIAAVPMIFRRPIVYVNFIPLEYVPTWSPHQLFIPKKLWLRGEHRLMTFREILDVEKRRILSTNDYEQRGIEIVENTPEEITALAVEMDERLEGKWQTTEENEELQRRFWSLFRQSEINNVLLSHIGGEFLRQNIRLLD